MTAEELKEHAFVKAVFEAVRPVMVAEHEFQLKHRGAKWVPDEYQFYLSRVGNRLATLLSHCEQLSRAA